MEDICRAMAYWLENPKVYVDENNVEQDWWKDKQYKWKPRYFVTKLFPYTSVLSPVYDEISRFNFEYCQWDGPEGLLAKTVSAVWNRQIEDINHTMIKNNIWDRGRLYWDNKIVLQLEDRVTKQVIYLGFYDGKMAVAKTEPRCSRPELIVDLTEFKQLQ